MRTRLLRTLAGSSVHLLLIFVLAILAGPQELHAEASEPVAKVVRVQGDVVAVSDSRKRTLLRRAEIYVGETLFTHADARIDLRFNDGTIVTLGAETQFRIETFRYIKGETGNQAVFEFLKGAFRSVSGAVNKGSDGFFQVKTPVAVMGIRGTDFWGGTIFDSALDVLMIDGVEVMVINKWGEIALQPGEGTNVSSVGNPPSASVKWPQSKIDKAMAAIRWE